MSIVEIFLIAIGLSMDAFAVSVGKGLGMKRFDAKVALMLAFAFGLFQALMPVLGWFLAASFYEAMQGIDHWIAFILLFIIGGKMLIDTIRDDEDDEDGSLSISVAELLALAVATSIDAFAVGITFAALNTPLLPSVAIIGAVTFILSLCGVTAGIAFGTRFQKPAGILGGVILMAIGLKVLIEHLATGI